MSTFTSFRQNDISHAAFLDALSGEFIARTGCGVYVYLNPQDIHRLFDDYRQHGTSIRDMVRPWIRGA